MNDNIKSKKHIKHEIFLHKKFLRDLTVYEICSYLFLFLFVFVLDLCLYYPRFHCLSGKTVIIGIIGPLIIPLSFGLVFFRLLRFSIKEEIKTMGKMQKQKGARGERELAKKLEELFGKEAHRGRQYSGGPESPDINWSIEGIHVECKRTERLNLKDALEQSKRDSGSSDTPIVCHKSNNKNWVVALELDQLPELVRKLSSYV